MNKELNLVEILKDCPKGMKLWSPICGECRIDSINKYEYPIRVNFTDNGTTNFCDFTKEGKYFEHVESSECVLFPSKDNRDWSTFKAPKPKWNPDTLQPFDKVLVRDYSEESKWHTDLFEQIIDDADEYKYQCLLTNWQCCIPYNEETKHLLGTNQEAPEYYRI